MTDPGPLAAYRQRLHNGDLRPDSAQALAVEKLQALHLALSRYLPTSGQAGWKARFGLTRRRETPPQGLYLYGDVGRGKSLLMDLFFAASHIPHKRRVHFHAFMREVHARLDQLRRRAETDDPIPQVAADLAAEAWLLCFDELQVSDIADAMILGRLFEHLFEHGVVVVATSNRPPQDLYKDGLQRERFLPFIDLFCDRLDLLELDSEGDYRLGRLRAMTVYRVPADAAAAEALAQDFTKLTAGATAKPDYLTVLGRRIEIPLAASGVASASFDHLCCQPLGPNDYLEIAIQYHTLVLSGIPRLSADQRNEAKRFVTLIDALYEHRCNLLCSAEAPPDQLYPEGDFSFEFQRTASRLMEMQSETYITLPHLT